MSLLASIQNDIIDSSKPLAPALRKAQVLAYQLDNEEFKNWVDWELNGYSHEGDNLDTFLRRLPTYRKTDAQVACDMVTPFQRVSNAPIVMPNMPEHARTFWAVDGIPVLEQLLCQEGVAIKEFWPNFMIEFINNHAQPGQIVTRAWKQVPKTFFSQIVETVRGRLLKFILELSKQYPQLSNLDSNLGSIVSSQAISHLVYNYITVSNGGTMSTFDQRGQNVSGNQYNAGRDISFRDVQTTGEYLQELEKLKSQLEVAASSGSLDEDAATDTEYHLTKAIQITKKDQPDKSTILEHLTKVKSILTGIATMAGFVVALDKAIQALDTLF